MLSKMCRKIKEQEIKIDYIEVEDNDHFGIFNDLPVVLINPNLNELDTSIILLHETAHFLNGDCNKYITNHFQNDNLKFEANKYMIQEVMKILDDEYNFTPDTNYQRIMDKLKLPYHESDFFYE